MTVSPHRWNFAGRSSGTRFLRAVARYSIYWSTINGSPRDPSRRDHRSKSNATLFESDCNNIFRRAKDARNTGKFKSRAQGRRALAWIFFRRIRRSRHAGLLHAKRCTVRPRQRSLSLPRRSRCTAIVPWNLDGVADTFRECRAATRRRRGLRVSRFRRRTLEAWKPEHRRFAFHVDTRWINAGRADGLFIDFGDFVSGYDGEDRRVTTNH